MNEFNQTPYGYVYITTNLCNGMRYIGQHGGKFNPRYKGSGSDIRKAFKEFGKENFIVELICYANTFEELNDLESFYIKKYDAVVSEMFYNKIDIPLHWDLRDKNNVEYLSNISHEKPCGFSDKIREIKMKTNERKGKLYWITNGSDERLVNKFEHESMYSSYIIGRLGDLIYMCKGNETIKVNASDESKYSELGYSRGKSEIITENVRKSRQKEIWTYNNMDFNCARELTDFLNKNGYPNIVNGTVVNISNGKFIKSYPDLFGKICRRPKNSV